MVVCVLRFISGVLLLAIAVFALLVRPLSGPLGLLILFFFHFLLYYGYQLCHNRLVLLVRSDAVHFAEFLKLAPVIQLSLQHCKIRLLVHIEVG